MKVSTERIENSQVVVNIEAEAEEVERSLEGAYRRLADRVEIPGFRRGKAPRAMVESYIGKEALLENALEHLIPQLLMQAVDEQGIDPIAQPEVEVTQIEPVIFKATVPLRPTVELGDYGAISIDKEKAEVSEDEVGRVIERLRSQSAPWEPVERPIQFGDLVTIDVVGTAEDKPLVNRDELQFQVLKELPVPVPGFAEKLEGMEKGQDAEFTISLPEDFAAEELAGKDCNFKVKVSEVKELKLPELDDEFAKGLGQGFETLDALKEDVTSNLQLMAEEGARRRYEDKVISAVVESSKVEFPPVMVEQEIERLIAAQERDLAQRRVSLEDYLKSRDKSREELREEVRPLATRQVTGALVLTEVAGVENIEVTDEDIDAEIESIAKGAGEQGEELKGMLQSAENRRSLMHVLVTRRTIERLMAIASGEAQAAVVDSEAPSAEDETPSAEAAAGEAETAAVEMEPEQAEASSEEAEAPPAETETESK